ncbi:MAG: hypothetical protein CMF46_01560 [Legionellales bacterium]|nr:hypothetical protein [Legionellales bacterium]|tara:strand:- start:526 stop:1518 length:993 start_codon:yes stop_codon:yes gene_type:complete
MKKTASFFYQTVSLFVIGYCCISLVKWFIVDATWLGDSPSQCQPHGYCWIYVSQHLMLLIFGFYPIDQVWRVVLFFVLMALFSLAAVLVRNRSCKPLLQWLLWIQPTVALWYLVGGWLGLEVVDTSKWGGLFLSVWLTSFCFSWGLVLGLVFAIMRQSKIILVSILATALVEVIRSLPLILVLFVSTYWHPLGEFMVGELNRLSVVSIALTVFAAVYLSEVFRAGLSAFPNNEILISKSIGLTGSQQLWLVKLPQITQQMMPSFVNILIGLFKDTTLVVFVGLFDLLAMIDITTHSAKWLSSTIDAIIFVMLVYWLVCYLASRLSESLKQ